MTPARRAALAAPYLAAAVAALWTTRSFWFPGRYVVGFDTYAYSGPNLEVTERAVRAGRLPLVNDLVFAGVPHLGNPQAGVLYPPRLLTLLLETNRAMGVLVALHVVLLGTGMVVLARRLGVGRVGAGAAGVVAVASGAVLAKTIQFEQILVLAWAPWLLVAVHLTLTGTRPWRAVAALGGATAAVLLAGHPQLVYETMFLALAGTIGFAIGGERWRRLPHVGLGVVLGALVALPQLVAAADTTRDSAIGVGRDLDALRSPALSLDPGLVVRALLGTVQDRDPAEFAGAFESVAAVGVGVAVLAVVGWVQALGDPRRRPWSISLTALAVLAVVWASGPRSALFRAAYDVLPGFDLARASARWLVIAVLVVALHAGVGTQAVVERVRTRHLAGAAGAVAVVGLALLVDLATIAERRSAGIWAASAVLALALLTAAVLAGPGRARRAFAVALVVVAAGELAVMSLHAVPQRLVTDTPFTAHHAPSSDWLAERGASTIALTDDGRGAEYQVPGFRPNTNALAEVPSVDGYDGGVQITDRWAAALGRFRLDPPAELPLRNSLDIPIVPAPLARLGVRYVLLDRARTPATFIPGWVGPLVVDDRFEVWENPDWVGEAVAWSSAEAVDAADAPELLRTDAERYASTALVDHVDGRIACTEPAPCDPVGLDVERRSPEHLVVRTGLDRPTVVSVARQALPGWEVRIDGEPAGEVVVDGLFLGVEVPAGEHEITWRYTQRGVRPALFVAIAAVIALGVLAVSPGRGTRGDHAQVDQ